MPLAAEPMLVTIDDLPLVDSQYFTREQQEEIVLRVLDALDAHRITALVFANGAKLQPHLEPLMDEVVRRGHLIGSHTYSHPSLNRLSVEEYGADIVHNDAAIASWMTTPKYFRFPYLETGATREARDAIAKVLADHGYRNVPVTVDSDDWDFNTRFTRAAKAGDEAAAAACADDYVAFVLQSGAEARSLAREKLGREIHHVLLLHLNYLNSLHLDRLLTALEKDGWSFAGVDETLADPVYSLEDEYYGMQGLTWLDRVMR